ncbi:MAG: peptide chain release factor 2 [Deltaproteobacteria bacterium]|nr:peptide chain release factor 2 [Deltaproteobacteria bacterium]MBW1929470.1 peptide chain release factor 2 [Deltaproteobacteria bacterium]MBW2023871.1 peptide chain release factor 2 [Deltaproteobacteria bacterium]MBW2124160.1 peptide chain release factor 2 [Deltaproteobacteria bacterium]RLB23882.1 MAG: peptide chain release factor 2 [Deltaproteobacteria bacterium]
MVNLNPCEGIFDIDGLKTELAKIEKVMAEPSFWQKDQEETSRISQKRATLQEKIEGWEKYKSQVEEAKILADMAWEENDEETLREVYKEVQRLEKEINILETQSLLGEPDDHRNAIVAINAGAGGTEAQDWVEMLFRMYTRWAEDKGMKTSVIDFLAGEEAGIKNVTFTVSGPYAYGLLKSEHGIHRMVRISPFDATGRRHTSFASVSVLPEVDTDIKIEIDEKDLRIDTFRASGPGGQHVNKTSSAVRITHLPTGIVVQCQNEKSQHRNKDLAMKVLKAKLYELEKKKLEAKKQEMHQSQKEIAWGSQIRSYVFNPYRLVKDHRTGVEIGDLERVMDGDIDPFIDAYLRMKTRQSSDEKATETAQAARA